MIATFYERAEALIDPLTLAYSVTLIALFLCGAAFLVWTAIADDGPLVRPRPWPSPPPAPPLPRVHRAVGPYRSLGQRTSTTPYWLCAVCGRDCVNDLVVFGNAYELRRPGEPSVPICALCAPREMQRMGIPQPEPGEELS